MKHDKILVCLNPLDACWQLGDLAAYTGCTLLLGWRLDTPTVDSGVPFQIAQALAGAFSALGRLTYLTQASAGSAIARDSSIRRSHSPILSKLSHLQAGWDALFARAVLRSATDARDGALMFADGYFSWSLQGQVGVITSPNLPLPALDVAAIIALASDAWMERGKPLFQIGVNAIIRPGVDGDVVGFFASNANMLESALLAIEAAAADAGLAYVRLDEPDFREMLALPGN